MHKPKSLLIPIHPIPNLIRLRLVVTEKYCEDVRMKMAVQGWTPNLTGTQPDLISRVSPKGSKRASIESCNKFQRRMVLKKHRIWNTNH